MNTIIVVLSLAVVTCAAPQYGGGSGGGLLGHHEPLSYQIIGLSRGSEDQEEEHNGGYENSGHGGGYEQLGGQGGGYGGSSGGGGGHGESSGEGGGHGGSSGGSGYGGSSGGGGYGEEYKKHDESIGFTGSDFKTPVDVHHEKEIHIKAHPEYHYAYHVADQKHKDFKSKHESRDGTKVKGSYSLLEPDHKTVRVVDYVADKKLGFIAKVSYKKQSNY